nr:hypothetical protein CFP56_03202 [Quercus suber]
MTLRKVLDMRSRLLVRALPATWIHTKIQMDKSTQPVISRRMALRLTKSLKSCGFFWSVNSGGYGITVLAIRIAHNLAFQRNDGSKLGWGISWRPIISPSWVQRPTGLWLDLIRVLSKRFALGLGDGNAGSSNCENWGNNFNDSSCDVLELVGMIRVYLHGHGTSQRSRRNSKQRCQMARTRHVTSLLGWEIPSI